MSGHRGYIKRKGPNSSLRSFATRRWLFWVTGYHNLACCVRSLPTMSRWLREVAGGYHTSLASTGRWRWDFWTYGARTLVELFCGLTFTAPEWQFNSTTEFPCHQIPPSSACIKQRRFNLLLSKEMFNHSCVFFALLITTLKP